MTKESRPSVGAILARNTFASWIHYAIASLSTLLLTPLVIRAVGVPSYGLWILMTQIVGYGGLVDLAIQPAITKYIAAARAEEDDRESNRLLSSALVIQVLFAAWWLAALWLVAGRIDQWFELGPLQPAVARRVLFILGFGTALGLPASAFTGVLKGFQRQDLVAWLGSASQIVRVIGLVLVVWRDLGLVGLATAVLAANLVGYLGTIYATLVQSRGLLPRWSSVSRDVARRLLGFGFFSFAGSAGWYLIYATDAVVIGSRIGAAEVASYAVAATLITFVAGTVSAFSTTLMPLASELEARGARAENQRTFLFGTRFSLQLALPMVLGLLVWGPDLIAIWVGPSLAESAGPLLRILMIAQLAALVKAACVPMAIGVGWLRPAALLVVIEGLANLGLSLFLATRMGVPGVAIGTLVPALVLQGVVWPALACRLFDLSRRDYWKNAILPALLPLCWTLPGVTAVRLLFSDGSRYSSMAWMVLFAFVYWLIAFKAHLLEVRRRWWKQESREMEIDGKVATEQDS